MRYEMMESRGYRYEAWNIKHYEMVTGLEIEEPYYGVFHNSIHHTEKLLWRYANITCTKVFRRKRG
jgi:hypothetical protein